MWLVGSKVAGTCVMIVSAVCAGTWPSTHRWATTRTKAQALILFVDFIGAWVIGGLFLCLLLGNIGSEKPDLPVNLRHATFVKALYAFIGGGCMIWGMFFVMQAAPMAGQAIVFPIAVGLGTGFGTLFTYLIQPKGNLPLLIAGTVMALVSVACGAVSNWEKTRYERKQAKKLQTVPSEEHEIELGGTPSSNAPLASMKGTTTTTVPSKNTLLIRGIVLCVMAGLVWSGWSALSTLAQRGHGCTPTNITRCDEFNGLSPYGAHFYFTFGVAGLGLGGLPVVMLAPLNPLMKPTNPITAYLSLGLAEHGIMVIGGLLQSFAVACNFAAGPIVGYAISLVIVNANPLIAAMWGIFVWKELHGTNWKMRLWFGLMCVGFVLSLVLVVLSSYKD